jgi:Na+-driven multidrug efflux pump
VLLLTVMRLLLIAVPLAWAMVFWWGTPIEGVWGSMLLGSAVTAVVAAIWLRSGLARVARGTLRSTAAAPVEAPVEVAPV